VRDVNIRDLRQLMGIVSQQRYCSMTPFIIISLLQLTVKLSPTVFTGLPT